MNYYTIKDLETLSGIKAHTIRMWEKRYGLLNPNRTSTNIRHYNDEELRYLLNIALLVKQGFKISKVSNFDKRRLQEEVLKLTTVSGLSIDIIDRLIVCMINFEDDNFEELLDQQIDNNGIENVMVNIVFPLFKKIGTYWQIGSIFPAQEHFVSVLIRQRLISISEKFRNKNQKDKSILFYLPQNEMHELGMLFYNYIALKEGLKTIYLGSNIPIEDLRKISENLSIDYVCTAFINAVGKEKMEEYFIELKKIFIGKTVLVSGAQVITHQPRIPSGFLIIDNVETFIKSLKK